MDLTDQIDLTEGFIDASFTAAKKGAPLTSSLDHIQHAASQILRAIEAGG